MSNTEHKFARTSYWAKSSGLQHIVMYACVSVCVCVCCCVGFFFFFFTLERWESNKCFSLFECLISFSISPNTACKTPYYLKNWASCISPAPFWKVTTYKPFAVPSFMLLYLFLILHWTAKA